MKLKTWLVTTAGLISPASAQITGESAEAFIGAEIVGFLDSVVVSEVSTWADFVAFVVLPLLGMYGIARFLTSHAFLEAENNLSGNNGIESTDELSDQADSASNLVSIAIAVTVTIFYGGFTLVFVTILGLIGIIWFIRQFWGAANNVSTSQFQEELGRLGSDESEVEELERAIEDGGTTTQNPEDVEASVENLDRVARILMEEEKLVADLLSIEDDELEDAILNARKYLELRRLEHRAFKYMGKTAGEVEKYAQNIGLNDKKTKKIHAKAFKEFFDENPAEGERLWKSWNNSQKRDQAINQTGKDLLRRFDLSGLQDFPGDISSNAYNLGDTIEKIEELEASHNLRKMRDEIRRAMRQQRKSMEKLKRFKKEMEHAFEDEKKLEKMVKALGKPELHEKVERDREELLKVQKSMEKISDNEHHILTIENRLEEIEQDIIDLKSSEDISDILEEAEYAIGSMLVLRDAALIQGRMEPDGKLHERLFKTAELLNRGILLTERMKKEERSSNSEIDHLLEELERTTEEMVQTLVDERN